MARRTAVLVQRRTTVFLLLLQQQLPRICTLATLDLRATKQPLQRRAAAAQFDHSRTRFSMRYEGEVKNV